MSAMTAPIGWRRTLAAICSGVGRCAMRTLASTLEGAVVASPGCARGIADIPGDEAPPGGRVQAVGVAEEPRSERVGAVQAAGDACEDQRDIGGAEAGYDGAGVGEGALADRGGEFAAVVDQLADEAEQGSPSGWAGWMDRGRCGLGWHERNKNMEVGGRWQGIYSARGVDGFVDVERLDSSSAISTG